MHRMMKFVNFGRIKSVLNNIFSIIYKNQRSIDFHWLNKVHLLISIISLLMPWLFHPQLHSILPVKLSIAISIKSAKIWHFYIEIKFNLSSFFHSLLILSHTLFLKQIFFSLVSPSSVFFFCEFLFIYIWVNHMKVFVTVIFCLFVHLWQFVCVCVSVRSGLEKQID